MLRSLLPFTLASLGLTIILLATTMPLFEWQIDEMVTDFPEAYEVNILPSPWTTRFRDSLSDSSFISSGHIYVSKNGKSCSQDDLSFVVKRSQRDETLENVPQNLFKKHSKLLFVCGVMVIVLSLVYIWWYTISYEHRSVLLAVIFTVIAGVLYVELTQILRPLLPRIIPFEYFGALDCYRGIITFNARLSEIHYETPIVFFTGLFLVLGAPGVMLRQVIKAINEEKESSKSAAG